MSKTWGASYTGHLLPLQENIGNLSPTPPTPLQLWEILYFGYIRKL